MSAPGLLRSPWRTGKKQREQTPPPKREDHQWPIGYPVAYVNERYVYSKERK